MAALLVFLVFLAAIVITVPIGTGMILGAVSPIMFMDKGGSIVQVLNNTFSGANSTPILAVPLFILGGVIMAEGGISRRLFNVFAYFVGKVRGRPALRVHPHLPVLRRDIRFRPRDDGCRRLDVHSVPRGPWI